jgi:putative inorganic carbon (HCO3(-)) transporter
MPLKTILWAGFFVATCFGALGAPIWGIIGYVGHYSIGAERQWWEAPLSPLGIRYSFTLAAFTALGIAVNWGKLRFGPKLFCRQEKLLLLFLGIVWLLVAFGPETVGHYTQPGIDHPSMKLTKIVIFTLMLTHVVTDLKNLDRLLWVLVIGALILGLQAYSTPYSAFVHGRLDSVGGPDFSEGNFFAAYMAAMLPIIGVQFLRTRGIGKLLCLVSGVFTTNAIVLTRSRGAFVGLAAGAVMAALLAPRKYRTKIFAGLLVAGLGGLYLCDPQFLARMTTIDRPEEQRDRSAQSRIELTKLGLRMFADHPLGIGVGNFFQTVGGYDPAYEGRDAHNTYIRCLTELGIQGLLVFGLLIANAWVMLRRINRRAEDLPPPHKRSVLFLSYGMCCALATMAACCLTISLTYVEFIWWFLALPVCLERAVDNTQADMRLQDMEEDATATVEWFSVQPAA